MILLLVEEIQKEIDYSETRIVELETQKRKISNEINSFRFKLEELKNKLSKLQSKQVGDKDWLNENFEWSKHVKSILKTVFKFDDFKSSQLSAINAYLSKEDLILIMPTGGGKSLAYQLPALVTKGLFFIFILIFFSI